MVGSMPTHDFPNASTANSNSRQSCQRVKLSSTQLISLIGTYLTESLQFWPKENHFSQMTRKMSRLAGMNPFSSEKAYISRFAQTDSLGLNLTALSSSAQSYAVEP